MKKDLSIAMAIAKKNKMKKMAEGGKVDKLHQGAMEARKYDSQKSEKGVHTPKSPYAHNKESMGESYAGYLSKSDSGVEARTGKPVSKQGMNDDAKKEHRRVMTENRKIKPKLQGLAEGGMVESKIINPRKVDALGQVLKNKEAHLMSTLPPEDETEHIAYDDDHALHSKQFAEGGMINEEVSMDMAENDELEHPAGLEMDNDMMKPSDEEIMASHFAEGGEVLEDDDMMQPEPEADDEDHASIAAAIMSKRAKFAAGGMVDIDSNAEESPNMYYKLNRAALKENYDSDMDDVSQPMDSNEHGDSIDADEHDRISIMRRKMALKRMAK